MANGDFTPTVLLAMKLKSEQMWKDSQLRSSVVPHADAAVAILNKQTARFEVLNNRDKDLEVKVTFVNPCGIEAQDCTTNCDIVENELSTGIKTYKPNICKRSGFSIDVTKLRTNDYNRDEIYAEGMAGAIKALDEFWARQALVKLKTFAGVNISNPNYNAASGLTTIPNLGSDLKSLTQLMQDGMLNRIDNAYFIDNGIFYGALTNAAFDAGNAEGKGAAARLKVFQDVFYSDMWNFKPAGIVNEDVFMIGTGAVAMKTVNKNPDSPLVIGGQVGHTIYTVKSNLLPGVSYDVFYTITCQTVNGKAHYFHTWRLETNGLIELNPEGCPVVVGNTTATPTGVLAYADGVNI